ncbi:MAG TPA: tRNA (adenosine(37)-N6)-threonylcarbamoyltransferase complex dimerization subunit type 1 TsaB [Clostridiales bacterium]|nr:tRNA (adenosine(37)-N6)-threonylcarbamoyltransferase complex dimerization subunit type 1 TsaB [Clostridiales bacterium]
MNTLFIDTSSDNLLLAVSNGEAVFEKKINNVKRHSKIILNKIEELLSSNFMKITDINLILVVVGPGSFTGIRIGVSTANAIAKALNIKIIGLTSLELMMVNEPFGVALKDCKNNNYYFYNKENNKYGVINIENFDLYKQNQKVFLEYKPIKDIFSYVFENKDIFDLKNTVTPFYIKTSSAKKRQS